MDPSPALKSQDVCTSASQPTNGGPVATEPSTTDHALQVMEYCEKLFHRSPIGAGGENPLSPLAQPRPEPISEYLFARHQATSAYDTPPPPVARRPTSSLSMRVEVDSESYKSCAGLSDRQNKLSGSTTTGFSMDEPASMLPPLSGHPGGPARLEFALAADDCGVREPLVSCIAGRRPEGGSLGPTEPAGTAGRCERGHLGGHGLGSDPHADGQRWAGADARCAKPSIRYRGCQRRRERGDKADPWPSARIVCSLAVLPGCLGRAASLYKERQLAMDCCISIDMFPQTSKRTTMNVTPHWASHLKRPAAWAEASDEYETWLVPDFHIAHLHGSRSRLPQKRLRGEGRCKCYDRDHALVLTDIRLKVINWEFRDKKTVPKWYRGIQAAKRLLDQSDPGYRFKRPENVQSSKARRHLGGMVAEDAIFNAVIAKLDLSQTRCPFPWLLEGGERDVRRIAGLLGMSPKLLHTFAQITHLCGRYANESTSLVYPLAIKAIERQLENFWQWSELCNGFGTSEALFESCELDSDGKVDDSGKVTLLGAEAHAASARLYLQCRFYRGGGCPAGAASMHPHEPKQRSTVHVAGSVLQCRHGRLNRTPTR
ncbi:hypothetical protein FH972_024585 [Carpinus fangiana]|uniref:Uncharacterized protein n=1 Tax=Carpinus fangiana TaxID=176857 RepID=A0A5N6KYR5_9ROSI|nr:hypothetical protein FH972_024585 [Carpinus fangiana]